MSDKNDTVRNTPYITLHTCKDQNLDSSKQDRWSVQAK